MTQNNAGERRKAAVTVVSALPTEGKFGKQWTLKVRYPWQKEGKTVTAWIDRDASNEELQLGVYQALLERGTKWATDRTDDDDWMYNWMIIGSLSGGEGLEPSGPAEAPKPFAAPADATRTSIERQTAGKEVGGWVREMIAKGLIVDMPTAVQAYVYSIDAVHEATAAQTPARTEERDEQRTEDPMDGTDEPFPV